MKKYFSQTENAKRRNDITNNFKQKNEETLSDAWNRFKRWVKNCPHNGFSECMQIKIFYVGLNKNTQ